MLTALTSRSNSEHATHVARNFSLFAGANRALLVCFLALVALVSAKLGFHAYPYWLTVQFLEFADRKDLEIFPDADLFGQNPVWILFQPTQNEE